MLQINSSDDWWNYYTRYGMSLKIHLHVSIIDFLGQCLLLLLQIPSANLEICGLRNSAFLIAVNAKSQLSVFFHVK